MCGYINVYIYIYIYMYIYMYMYQYSAFDLNIEILYCFVKIAKFEYDGRKNRNLLIQDKLMIDC